MWRTTPKDDRINGLINFVLTKFRVNSVNIELSEQVKTFIKNISEQFRRKWVAKYRREDIFNRHYGNWLEQTIKFPNHLETLLADDITPKRTRKSGRPTKDFSSSSDRSKRRKMQHLLNTYDTEELAFAAGVSARESGKRDAANIIQEVAVASPKRSTKYKKAVRLLSAPKMQQPYSPDEALALFIFEKLSVHQYKTMQMEAVERGYDIYPSYYYLAKAKKYCYPPLEKITVTDTSVEIELQHLIDHTVQRLCSYLGEVIDSVTDKNLVLYFKWGCDGSSGHSLYKQTFENEENSDEYLFSISLVPLRLYSEANSEKILWQNPRPSSTRFCRPIKLMFRQETDQLTKQECDIIQRQIDQLVATKVEMKTKTIEVNCVMALTMVDTKVCNALTGTKSAQKCYICGSTPKDTNSIQSTRPPNENTYSFGISSLHAWIRSFEALLHIAYRIEIKKWQIRGPKNKARLEERKKEIQKLFKREVGLIVDKPKSGAGNTNDGNTARRFFNDAETTSKLTGLNQEILERFDVLLRTLSSGFEIDVNKFETYATETKELYLRLYEWYPMPVTVHKILCHSKDIINNFLLPIGQMSEEAQEARNKEIRKVREGHTRKKSRVVTNMDMFLYLLVASDSKISSIRKTARKKAEPLPRKVLDLLKSPDL